MNTKNEYLLLFTGSEWCNQLPYAEVKQLAEDAKAWMDDLVAQGKAKSGTGLARTGARVTGKTGQIVLDGPYAETKEAIGGFILLEAASLEEALAVAKQNPAVRYGTTIEVRPVFKSYDDCPLYKRVKQLEQEHAAVAA